MALIKTLITSSPISSFNGQFIPYERSILVNQVEETIVGKPFLWFQFTCFEDFYVTNPDLFQVVEDNGFIRLLFISLPTTYQVTVGDHIGVLNSTYWGEYYAQITKVRISEGFTLDVTTDQPFLGSAVLDGKLYISYNRMSEVAPFIINRVDDPSKQIRPKFRGVFQNALVANVPDESYPYYAIGLDMEQASIALSRQNTPSREADGFTMEYSYGLVGETRTFENFFLTMALEFGIPTSADGYTILSSILDGKAYKSNWVLPNSRVITLLPYAQDNGQTIANVYAPVDYASMPTKLNEVGSNPFWVIWKSRYGGFDLWCFNYDQTNIIKTKSIGEARVGYDILDLGKQVTGSYKLSTGLINKIYSDWFEDLQASPQCWFTQDLQISTNSDGLSYIDVLNNIWTKCSVADMGFVKSTANGDLIEFQPELVVSTILKSYKG